MRGIAVSSRRTGYGKRSRATGVSGESCGRRADCRGGGRGWGIGRLGHRKRGDTARGCGPSGCAFFACGGPRQLGLCGRRRGSHTEFAQTCIERVSAAVPSGHGESEGFRRGFGVVHGQSPQVQLFSNRRIRLSGHERTVSQLLPERSAGSFDRRGQRVGCCRPGQTG